VRQPPASALPAEALPVRGPRSILLVEDNPVNLKLALRMLEKRGYAVATASNGIEALAALEGHIFDVVLMDVQMPEMGGLEATAEIRARELRSGARIPIIAVTAHALEGDRERCLVAGMDDYIPKPIKAPELFATIERWSCNGDAKCGVGSLLPSPYPPPSMPHSSPTLR
jgi:CheY-like chemotaxis protein